MLLRAHGQLQLVGRGPGAPLALVPRGKAYWFQSTSKEPSILFRVSARHPNIPNERYDYGTAFSPNDPLFLTVVPVPEPSGVVLAGAVALAGAGVVRRSRRG